MFLNIFKRTILIFLFIIMVVFISRVGFVVYHTACYFIEQIPYESDYFGKVWAPTGKGRSYNQMIKVFGEPKEVKITTINPKLSANRDAIYDDFIIRYDDSDNPSMGSIRVLSDKYRFGKKSIGVGSTKKEVEKAYRFVKKASEPNAYIDAGWWVEFYYDENDIVTEILIYCYP